jgi:hypothetical protein
MRQYQTCPRFSWKKLAAGSVILDLEKGSYFTLNDTASLIWAGLIEGKPADAIAASLVETFEVPLERAREDTEETIAMLAKEGVLEPC